MGHIETAAGYLQTHDVRQLPKEKFSGMSELLLEELYFIALKKIWKDPTNPLNLNAEFQGETDDNIIWACGHNIGRYVTLELIEAAYVNTELGHYSARTDDWAKSAIDDYMNRYSEDRLRRRHGSLGSKLAEKTEDIMQIGASAIVQSGELHLPTTFSYRQGYMTISAVPELDTVEACRTEII